MTINEVQKKYADKPGMFDFFANSAEVWNNGAALGYVILAAHKLNYTPAQIKALVDAVQGQFDDKTLIEAEAAYQKSQY